METPGSSFQDEEKETARVEAFSDGVYAIAITLLVLELKVPRDLAPGHSLADALLHQWPSYVAFLISFGTILIMWVNHHRLFTLIRKSDNRLLMFNGLLLLVITVVPFPTSLIAEHFRDPDDGCTAALIYSAHGFNIAVAYNLLWRHAIGGNGRLLAKNVDLEKVNAITRQYRFGPLLYVISFGLAFVSVTASMIANAGLAVLFTIPPPEVRRGAVIKASD